MKFNPKVLRQLHVCNSLRRGVRSLAPLCLRKYQFNVFSYSISNYFLNFTEACFLDSRRCMSVTPTSYHPSPAKPGSIFGATQTFIMRGTAGNNFWTAWSDCYWTTFHQFDWLGDPLIDWSMSVPYFRLRWSTRRSAGGRSVGQHSTRALPARARAAVDDRRTVRSVGPQDAVRGRHLQPVGRRPVQPERVRQQARCHHRSETIPVPRRTNPSRQRTESDGASTTTFCGGEGGSTVTTGLVDTLPRP